MHPGEINMETSTTNTTRCSVDSVLRQLDLHHGDVSDICDLWELRGRGAADGDNDGIGLLLSKGKNEKIHVGMDG